VREFWGTFHHHVFTELKTLYKPLKLACIISCPSCCCLFYLTSIKFCFNKLHVSYVPLYGLFFFFEHWTFSRFPVDSDVATIHRIGLYIIISFFFFHCDSCQKTHLFRGSKLGYEVKSRGSSKVFNKTFRKDYVDEFSITDTQPEPCDTKIPSLCTFWLYQTLKLVLGWCEFLIPSSVLKTK